jgi:hypothetical protein
MNTVGEPDEGKLHVRIDEGRLARQPRRTSRLLYKAFGVALGDGAPGGWRHSVEPGS